MLRVLLNPASGNNIETWDKTKKYLESHHIPYDLKYFEKEYRLNCMKVLKMVELL